MQATATKGVWTQDIREGYKMLVDTNNNIVMVTTPGGPVNYPFPDGITISDVEYVKADIIKKFIPGIDIQQFANDFFNHKT